MALKRDGRFKRLIVETAATKGHRRLPLQTSNPPPPSHAHGRVSVSKEEDISFGRRSL